MKSKALVLRLSSLGDVVLASSILEVSVFSQELDVGLDWVVAQEYAEILKGHPKIQTLFEFDRKTGLLGWIRLARLLWDEHYDVIFDLHLTLRTFILKLLFRYWSLQSLISQGKFSKKTGLPIWKTISKERKKLYFYFIFKKFWPQHWRPSPWIERYTRCVGGTGLERPLLNHLFLQTIPSPLITWTQPYLCVMPSSRWKGKKWPIESYVSVLKHLPYFPVILGHQQDVESLQLVEQLKIAGIPCFSGVGQWNLTQTAWILKNSIRYLGSDTGLAHLAEAVGVPCTVILGPTVPDMGFGVWRHDSHSIGLSLGCRPCGKDGRFCYRLTQKHQCLKGLSSSVVLLGWKNK